MSEPALSNRSDTSRPSESQPLASIVIRAFNEERHIDRLLESIREQTVTDHEVIVVDSGSFDRTPEIARRHDARLIGIDSQDFTFGYSLNVGIRAARAPIVAIVSAHTEPIEETWLQNLIAPFDDDRVAMTYGRQVGVAESKFSECTDFVRTFGARRLLISPDNVFANNANSAIRRSLWEKMPFDERLPGLEDIAWAKHWLEEGMLVVYEPDAGIRHIHEETWPQVYRRYYREAVAARSIGVTGRRDIPRLTMLEAAHFFSDVTAALGRGELSSRFSEILKFRLTKARATASGLLSVGDAIPRTRSREFFFDRDYRAVVIRSPGHASLERVESEPVAPREVLVRVAFVGVCGTDLEVFDGRLGYFATGLSSYPLTPGHEFSGVVSAIGAKVDDLEVGAPVVVECIQSCQECEQCDRGNTIACAARAEVGVMRRDGAYAEFVKVPGRFVHRLPPGCDLKRAALTEPLAVVLKGFNRLSRFLSQDLPASCAVVGGGPIGWLMAQVLRHRGHHPVILDRDARRRTLYEAEEIPICESLEDLESFDAIVEATGDPNALQKILSRSRAGCVMLLLGLPYARHDFSFEHIVAFDKTVIGSVGSGAAEFREAISLLPSLSVEPLVGQVLPLESFADAWAMARRREHLKVLLQP